MSVSQADKAKKLRALHEAPGAFVIPNPWDAGSARMLAGLGYEALATSSGAKAGVLGKRDGKVTREEALANARAIAEAVDVPVIGDLEKGFGDSPDAAAETIRQAAGVGLVGGSIEDATGDQAKPIYDFNLAVERVAAAVAVARAQPVPFLLTARAENLLHGRNDLDDTIRRLQAFEAAGADVLYAPGLKDLPTIRTVVSALGKPFNLVMTFADPAITLDALSAAGVKRVSIGGTLARYAMTGFLQAAREMREGRFGFTSAATPSADLLRAFGP